MNNSSSIEIAIDLWTNLNKVRGPYSINEFEEVIISLVFLRFIKEESLKGDLYKFDDSITIFDKNDFSLKQNIITANKRFDQIELDHLYPASFNGDYLTKIFNKIELDNPALEGVFSSFDFSSFLGKKEEGIVLNSIITIINTINVQEINFGVFFDELLERIINSNDKASESLQPKELVELMLSFLPKKDCLSIYNPFSGFGSFALNLPKNTIYLGEEIDKKKWSISKLRLLANKVKNRNNIENTHSFLSLANDNGKFDFIIANPRLRFTAVLKADEDNNNNQIITSTDETLFVISESLKKVKSKKGKIVITTFNSFLTSDDEYIVDFRKFLVENNFLEMVISLPSGILGHSSIPFSLLVLNSKNENLPIFVDASQCLIKGYNSSRKLDLDKIFTAINSDSVIKKDIEVNKIINNHYNLFPARYFLEDLNLNLQSGYKLMKLSDLIKPIEIKYKYAYRKGKFVKIKDLLNENPVYYASSFKEVEEIEIPKKSNILEKKAILLALRGFSLKSTVFLYSDRTPIYYSSNDILACKVIDKIVNYQYLMLELEKDYILQQIEVERSGTVMPFISKERLLSILIKIPDSYEQQLSDVKLVNDVSKKFKKKEVELQSKMDQFKKEHLEELGLKKHNIMQHLNNVKSSLDVLTFIMKQNNGILDAKSIINPVKGTTVAQRFHLLSESLKEVVYFVDNINDDFNFKKSEFLDAAELIKYCIEKGVNNELFDITFIDDINAFANDEDLIKPMIKFSRLDFEELYNNILQNAIRHGFTDPLKKYKFVIELRFDEELKKIVISFLNNGKPFPKGMAERYYLKGEKAGETSNKGFGSWKVTEIAKHFDAEVVVNDFPEEYYPVRIDLILNIENE
ncbi:N-6 DNA methylase [Flavobacterium sp. HJJ]|uniref:N-6 DNA methylase n=1 Tax=Flavobacterium sp. HJJ TaxID=2783792 RepID=UPI00188A3D8E|nr:N-6 DNA methylase [Flavobacterium sp. HJJ]MBF4473300.1 N-6 DNA methylase [Flavobacterium sp. HJJ]